MIVFYLIIELKICVLKEKKRINMKTAISYGRLFFKFLFVSILRTLKQFLA